MNSFVKNNNLLISKKDQDFPHDPNNLVFVFDTSLEPANNTISVPLNGIVNVTIDWGDDFSDTYTTTGFKTHTYDSPGVYIVQVSGTMTQLNYGTGGINADNKRKLVRCLSFGNIGLLSTIRGFRECINLIQCPRTLPSAISNTFEMFLECRSFNEDISSWNTSNITGMSRMFQNCLVFNQNIGNWNTSNVKTMNNMFRTATSFNQDIGNWNTSEVTSMSNMFNGATAFSQNISSWDVRKVTTMTEMFSGSNWGTANYDAALEDWANLADTDLKSQAITAFAAQSANTRVTSNGHGMVAGSRVNISGTTSYNGDFNVIAAAANTFDIGVTFVANDATGTMKHRRSRNVVAGFGTNKYNSGIPATARNVLTTTYNWIITDGGQV